jgi:tripartite-type tricarboxylate transporter receptor subunit TctC
VPFPPGGVNDTVARPWAEKMRDQLGPIVIENVGGAGGSIGAAMAARSTSDGYTLLLSPESTLLVTPIASKRPTYDWKSFEPIAFLVKSAVGFVVHPSAPFRTLSQVADFVKSKSGSLSYATAGSAHPIISLGSSSNRSPVRRISCTYPIAAQGQR